MPGIVFCPSLSSIDLYPIPLRQGFSLNQKLAVLVYCIANNSNNGSLFLQAHELSRHRFLTMLTVSRMSSISWSGTSIQSKSDYLFLLTFMPLL